MHDGEAEPRSLAGTFCGEEGLENMLPHLFAHADPRIGDREHDTGLLNVRECLPVARLHVPGFDGERAPFRHGVPRIDGQVQQHLLHL